MEGRPDIRLSFNRVPELYERARPGYPSQLFDTLFACLPAGPAVLEIGPGTGQATQSLLERGATVTAVELGPDLAGFLRSKFPVESRLQVINASFEEAPVPASHFDAVVCATAYHWIDQAAQIDRPIELLRPGGVLAVIDLIQVDSATDHGYFDRVGLIYDRYGEGRYDPPKTYDSAVPPIAPVLRASGHYQQVDVVRAPWDQTYSSTAYRDLLFTYSGTQMMAEPERSAMVDELVASIDAEFGGVVTRPLVATMTLAWPNERSE